MLRFKVVLSTLGISLLLTHSALAQDVHYWTHQYGTRSNLLGGAVIGSVLDLSGTYYNPGGLSLIETDDEELLMFAKVFQFPTITVKGIGIEERALSDNTLSEAPTLVAGSLPLKGLGNHWLGYSFLNRHETKFGLAGAGTGNLTVLNPNASDVPGAVDLRLYEKLNEPWYGVTWAYKISDRFGVGVSNYLTFRSHQLSYQTTLQALKNESQVSMVLSSNEYKYNYYGLLWKIGVAYDLDRLTLGFTLTTPGIKIYGNGRVGQNISVIRNDPENPDLMAVDYQRNLDVNYKSPLSVGVGITYKLGRTNLYGTTEWFSGIHEYVVIQGEDFTGQSSGETLPSRVTHELAAVLNVALGVEHALSRKFTLYGSFWTDYSARKDESTTNLSVTDWDLFHFMGGTTFTAFGSQITLGIGYAHGSKKEDQQPALDDPTLANIAKNYFSDLQYTYSGFKWVLGFSF